MDYLNEGSVFWFIERLQAGICVTRQYVYLCTPCWWAVALYSLVEIKDMRVIKKKKQPCLNLLPDRSFVPKRRIARAIFWTTWGNSLCEFCAQHCPLLITDAVFFLRGLHPQQGGTGTLPCARFPQGGLCRMTTPGAELCLHDSHSTGDSAGVTISDPFYKVIGDNTEFENLLQYRVHANSVGCVCPCRLHFRVQVERWDRYCVTCRCKCMNYTYNEL